MRDIFYTDINGRFVKIISFHHFDFNKKRRKYRKKNFRIKIWNRKKSLIIVFKKYLKLMISYTLTQILQEIKINKSVVFVFIRNIMICVEKEKIHQKMENR